MKENTSLKECEEEIEGATQGINGVLILPYRFIEPVILYRENGGKRIGMIGYKVNYRHFKHSLLPFCMPERLKEIELYRIFLTGECRQVSVRKIFRETGITERSLYFIPEGGEKR